MNLGLSIKVIRRELGITQYELSEKCGISQTSLSQIETGTKRPSPRIIYILGMQDSDVPESKKGIYSLIFPSIQNLALQIVSDEHVAFVASKVAV